MCAAIVGTVGTDVEESAGASSWEDAPVLTSAPRARRPRRVRPALLAALLYAVVTLALFPTVVLHLASAFPGDLGDPPSQAWILAWDLHALLTNPAHLYDGNIFYPFHDVLAYQDTLLGVLPLAAPILLATGSPLVAYNVLFLSSFVLCAWGAYLLARLLVGDTRAAFLAGLVYGFSPYRAVHLYHLNLLCGMWIPFALLSWERARRGKPLSWPLVGLFFVLQALSSLYYAAFLAVALTVLLALHLRRPLTSLSREKPTLKSHAPLPPGERTSSDVAPPRARAQEESAGLLAGGPRDRSALEQGAGVGAVPGRVLVRRAMLTAVWCVVVLWPFFAPYFRVERALGASRGLGQTVYFAADLRDFLHSVDGSVLYGWTGHAFGVRPNDALQYLWPGLVVLLLAVYGARRGIVHRPPTLSTGREATERRAPSPPLPRTGRAVGTVASTKVRGQFKAEQRARSAGRPYAVLCVVAAVLCLGPFLKVWGVQTGLPLPYLVLYALPGFAGLRDPARFGAIYTVALAMLAAYGAARVLSVPRLRGTWGGTFVAAALCAGVLAESWMRPLPAVPLAVGAATPPAYRWLAAHPDGRAVLELPIGLGDKTVWAEQAQDMYYATYHWRPIVNGTGGFAPPGYVRNAALYNRFPDAATLRLLRARGVRYVLAHRAWVGWSSADAIRARVAHASAVRLVRRWPDADLYDIAGSR